MLFVLKNVFIFNSSHNDICNIRLIVRSNYPLGLLRFERKVRRENGVPIDNLLAIGSSDTNYSVPLFVRFIINE